MTFDSYCVCVSECARRRRLLAVVSVSEQASMCLGNCWAFAMEWQGIDDLWISFECVRGICMQNDKVL